MTASLGYGTPEGISREIGHYLAEKRADRSNPNMDDAVKRALAMFPKAGRDRVREIYRNLTDNKRGRPPKNRG